MIDLLVFCFSVIQFDVCSGCFLISNLSKINLHLSIYRAQTLHSAHSLGTKKYNKGRTEHVRSLRVPTADWKKHPRLQPARPLYLYFSLLSAIFFLDNKTRRSFDLRHEKEKKNLTSFLYGIYGEFLRKNLKCKLKNHLWLCLCPLKTRINTWWL